MAAQARRKFDDHAETRAPAPRLGPMLADARAQGPAPSPALALQASLAEAFEGELVEDGVRWSTRRTLAFALVTCGAFWMGVGLVVTRVLAH
jgi:hypothetical protein